MKLRTFKALFLALVFSSLHSISAQAEPVNINTADAALLAASLNGIGPSKAAAIVSYREINGPFSSADQLADVKGVGISTVEKNREDILVTTEESEAN